MRQDVIGDNARRFKRMYARLDRQARESGIDFCDRVQAYKSLVLPRGDAQQRSPGLRVVRMALLGGGNKNCRIEENIHLARLRLRPERCGNPVPFGLHGSAYRIREKQKRLDSSATSFAFPGILATLSKGTQSAPRARLQGCAPNLLPVPRCPDGPTDHRA